jgi:hypothetical protein
MFLIFLVFCVVLCLLVGVHVAHLFSFLCCVFWWGSMLIIFLVFCVVLCLLVGVHVSHLFSFLCCVFGGGPCFSSF